MRKRIINYIIIYTLTILLSGCSTIKMTDINPNIPHKYTSVDIQDDDIYITKWYARYNEQHKMQNIYANDWTNPEEKVKTYLQLDTTDNTSVIHNDYNSTASMIDSKQSETNQIKYINKSYAALPPYTPPADELLLINNHRSSPSAYRHTYTRSTPYGSYSNYRYYNNYRYYRYHRRYRH